MDIGSRIKTNHVEQMSLKINMFSTHSDIITDSLV